MIYTDGNGFQRFIDREKARELDRREGRKRLVGEQVQAYKMLTAALNAVLFAEEELEKRLREHRLWASVKLAESCLRKVKMELASHVTVEQICTLQHDTSNCFLQIHHAQHADRVEIDQKTLTHLVKCARGLLVDENGDSHNCRDCMASMSQDAWQRCELYHMLLTLDCCMDGQDEPGAYSLAELLDIKGICPFMLGKVPGKEGEEDDILSLE